MKRRYPNRGIVANMVSDHEFDIMQPKAAAITASMRSIGYSMETAVADLIDNSITAGATRVQIKGAYKGSSTALFIRDNGAGMDEETLKASMRWGSSSPEDSRSDKDLGRFGLGLKTASFSQCRRFTVISKHNGVVSGRYWDLDVINETNEWRLRKDYNPKFENELEGLAHGTLVVWEKLDRIISELDSDAEKRFNAKKNNLRNHLGLTFHRFIEAEELQIDIGGVPVEAWNPFLPDKDYSQKKELPEVLACNGKVKIKGWVMPHKMYFSDSEYKKAGYNRGWTNMQGFYVYRGGRLLVAGGWLGLSINGLPIRQEQHYDLARICVDISNEQDFDWDIDIKKSKATPPDYLRQQLENVAKQTRLWAYQSYVFRGIPQHTHLSSGRPVVPLWTTAQERNNKLYYSINLEYPLVKELIERLDPSDTLRLKRLLKLLSETIPVQNIDFHANNQEQKDFSNPYEGADEEKSAVYKTLIKSFISQGYSEEEAIEQVKILLQL